VNHSTIEGMMTEKTTQEQDANQQTFDALKGIYYLIKNFQVNDAVSCIEAFDTNRLVNAGLSMYFEFLLANIALFRFEETSSLHYLLDADNHMTELVRVARASGSSLRCPNYLHIRSLIKWKLSMEHGISENRIKYREHAWRLVRAGIKNFDMDCFYWLRDQLQNDF